MKIKNVLSKIVVLSAAFYSFTGSALAAEQQLDSTAAIVNSGIILESDLDKQTRLILNTYRSRGTAVDELTARRQAMQSLVTRSLILQIAERNGYDMTDARIDSSLKQVAMRNNTTSEGILKSYGSNLSTAKARDRFKEDYLINEIRRSSVRKQITVSENEVNSLAKALKERGSVEPMYHLGQVIIPLSSNPGEKEYLKAKANANSAIAAIRHGANVESVAAKYAGSYKQSDLGYVPETSVPLPFLPAVVKARPGDVIGPFRSTIGLHILKVYDISKGAITPVKTYNAEHILIKTSVIFSDEAAVAKLNDILRRIKRGELTFAKAAKEYSEDPGTAYKGGDLGYQTLETFDAGFGQALGALSVGQYSEPVKSSYGWHLIHLKDVKIDKDSLDAYKDKARSIIVEREYGEAVASWERSLRESAYIHVLDKELISAGSNIEIDNNKATGFVNDRQSGPSQANQSFN